MSTDLWADNPDLQKRFDSIRETTRNLQKRFGITPRTLEQRYRDYIEKKEEESRIQIELEKIRAVPRPKIPKWRP